MPLSLKLQPPYFDNAEVAVFLLHSLFMIIAAVGIILLIVWMAKNLKAKQLLTWVMVLIVVGLLGSIITFRNEMDMAGKFFWGGSMSGNFGKSNFTFQGQQPLRLNSANKMMNMMYRLDEECKTADCETQVGTMMEPMMLNISEYMKNNLTVQ